MVFSHHPPCLKEFSEAASEASIHGRLSVGSRSLSPFPEHGFFPKVVAIPPTGRAIIPTTNVDSEYSYSNPGNVRSYGCNIDSAAERRNLHCHGQHLGPQL